MSTSSIPAAITALRAIFDQVAAARAEQGTNVQVIDGAGRRSQQTQIVLCSAGGSGDGEQIAAERAISGLEVNRDREQYLIACHATSFLGNRADNTAFNTLRTLCFGLVDDISTLIEADKTLGHTVIQARIADVGYLPSIPSDGPTVVVPFHILIQAQRRPQ